MKNVFISYSHADKVFTRKLAEDLRSLGCNVLVDEGEIKVGDRLMEKIRSAIDNVDYVIVVLSKSSIKSHWVRSELDIAMNKELDKRKVVLLPIMLHKVDPPSFIKGKLYADFSKKTNYFKGLNLLVRTIIPEKDYGARIKYISQLNKAKNLEELLEISIEVIEKITHTDYNQIFLENIFDGLKRPISVADTISPHKSRYRIANRDGLIGLGFSTKAVIKSGDVDANPHYIRANPESKSELVVPIQNERGKVVGVVNSEAEGYDYFKDSMIRDLIDFAWCLGGLLTVYGWRANLEAHQLPWIKKLPKSYRPEEPWVGEYDR